MKSMTGHDALYSKAWFVSGDPEDEQFPVTICTTFPEDREFEVFSAGENCFSFELTVEATNNLIESLIEARDRAVESALERDLLKENDFLNLLDDLREIESDPDLVDPYDETDVTVSKKEISMLVELLENRIG